MLFKQNYFYLEMETASGFVYDSLNMDFHQTSETLEESFVIISQFDTAQITI